VAAAAASTGRASAVERVAPEPASDAARELYERHEPSVFRFCLSRLRSREEAEDARQTTFLQAFRALRAGVVPIAESSWLLKIAENVCRSRQNEALRRTAFEVTGPPEAVQSLPAPAGAAPEVLMPLEEALARLTEPQRRALLLREWRGLSYREIAGELEIGQGAAEVLLFRARRALAAELEAPQAGPRRSLRSLDAA
jgi:RNA polymerase sigma-70 factor (ECF subfamily)